MFLFLLNNYNVYKFYFYLSKKFNARFEEYLSLFDEIIKLNIYKHYESTLSMITILLLLTIFIATYDLKKLKNVDL